MAATARTETEREYIDALAFGDDTAKWQVRRDSFGLARLERVA